jgi:Kdo2-lipid IVA lauroyltransferase/acyltransferase
MAAAGENPLTARRVHGSSPKPVSAILQYVLFACIAATLQRLPLRTVRWLARLFADTLFFAVPIRRKLTMEQLRSAFPSMNDRTVRDTARASFRNLVITLFELMWTPRLTDEIIAREVRFPNRDVITRAHRRGHGLIFLSAHFGNWEWMAICGSRILGLSYLVIVHPLHNPGVNRLVEGYRTRFGTRIVPMGLSIRDIVRTLRDRGIVAILGDQSGPSNAVFVPFFGRPAATYEGPAAFALRTGAPVVMAYSLRQPDGSYDVLAEEIPTEDLAGATDANIRELTRRHVRALERMIAQRPGDWLWQHKRWKHQPADPSLVVQDP